MGGEDAGMMGAAERNGGISSADVWGDLTALARAPAWPLERILTLPGRVRGALLTDWGLHTRRRYGHDEPDALRAAMGLSARDLPDAPGREDWYPIAWQLGLTRLLVERHLGGDILALEHLIHEDARRKEPRAVDKLARLVLTPRKLLSAAEKVYPHVYDSGGVEADVERHHAVFRWSGATFMGEPGWRVLQVFAVRGVFAALGKPAPECQARAASGGGFELVVRY